MTRDTGTLNPEKRPNGPRENVSVTPCAVSRTWFVPASDGTCWWAVISAASGEVQIWEAVG